MEPKEEIVSMTIRGTPIVVYVYRTPDGEQFDCVAANAQIAREMRDKWITENK